MKENALDHSPLPSPPLLFMNTRFDGSWPAVHELTLFQLAELAFVGWYTAMS